MIVYITLLLFLLILSLLEQEELNKDINSWIFVMIGIIFIYFLAFRYEVGYDYFNYKRTYDAYLYINPMGQTRFEKGFELFLFVFAYFLKAPFWVFIASLGLLSLTLKLYFFKKNTYNPYFIIMMMFPALYLGQDFGQFRQGLAISFTFLSILYINEHKFVKFLIFVFLASLFHLSAIIFLPAYFVNRVKLSGKLIIILLLGGVIFSTIDMEFILISLNRVMGNNSLINRLILYMVDEERSIISLNLIIQLFTIIGVYYLRERIYENNKIYDTMFKIYILGTFFSLAFNSIPTITSRGLYYYKFIDIILLPAIGVKLSLREFRIIYLFLMFLYCLYRVYNITTGQPDVFMPYNHVLNWR